MISPDIVIEKLSLNNSLGSQTWRVILVFFKINENITFPNDMRKPWPETYKYRKDTFPDNIF